MIPARTRSKSTLSIALIGMPGSGKSTIGRALARRLACAFVDSDTVIEQQAGCSIATLFAQAGEEAFRDREAQVLQELVSVPDSVIASGGGIVLRPTNRSLLHSRTRCVYLQASHELLWRRLRRDRRRPLLQGADAEERLRRMAAEREPLYRETAHVVIDTDNLPFDHLVAEVLRRASTS